MELRELLFKEKGKTGFKENYCYLSLLIPGEAAD